MPLAGPLSPLLPPVLKLQVPLDNKLRQLLMIRPRSEDIKIQTIRFHNASYISGYRLCELASIRSLVYF
jgi:hypothetical protein